MGMASVPEKTVMDVYDAVAKITDPGVPAYLKSTVNGADADKAYAAFLEFKDVDWLSPLYLKPLPGVSADKALKAVDKAIVMGSAMNGQLLQQAAAAHHKAIG